MRKYLLLFFFISIFIFVPRAQSSTLEDKQKQIEELEKKVGQLKSQAQTLNGQIVYYDNQITLNQLKISQTEDIISSISEKIDILESKLRQRAEVLEKQIVLTYKQGPADAFHLLLSSGNFSQFISRVKYTQIIQNSNRRLLHDTQVIQSNYAQQKDLIEASKVKLEDQKKTLATLKSDKENLLRETKNNQAVYQNQLDQAQLELRALEAALASAVSEGPVKAGDPIALVGNSGYPDCSTGKHLHFEVRQNNQWVNAENYLKPTTDKWGLHLGSGNWDWPLSGQIQITQRYGKTPYSYRYLYSGGIHTGIDMVGENDIVHAVADGTLYSSVQKCGSSNLKVKYIDHGNGLRTLYLHVQ